jgi:hypothetical protein
LHANGPSSTSHVATQIRLAGNDVPPPRLDAAIGAHAINGSRIGPCDQGNGERWPGNQFAGRPKPGSADPANDEVDDVIEKFKRCGSRTKAAAARSKTANKASAGKALAKRR